MKTNQADVPFEEWKQRLELLLQQTADDFRVCPTNELQQLRICACYFNRGEQEGFDRCELIDYLGISSPSVLDRAGYNGATATRVMELLPLLKDDKGVCLAPDELPPQCLHDKNQSTPYFL